MYTHICQICGMEFNSESNRAKYCIYCRNKAQSMRNKAYMQKRNSNDIKPIGSTQICPICNKEFIQKSGSQKCCPDCKEKQTNARKVVSNNKYKKANYEQINFVVPVGERDEIKAYAKSHNMSLNKLIITALKEYRDNHK